MMNGVEMVENGGKNGLIGRKMVLYGDVLKLSEETDGKGEMCDGMAIILAYTAVFGSSISIGWCINAAGTVLT